jgi:hypothetical protein
VISWFHIYAFKWVNLYRYTEDVEAALPEVMPLIDADLFGRAAEEREVEAIRGAYVEARRSRSHECLTLLATNASVPHALPELLAPVTRRLAAAASPSLRRKLEACLAAVQKGLLVNPHASPEVGLYKLNPAYP